MKVWKHLILGILAICLTQYSALATQKTNLPISQTAKSVNIIYIHGAYETKDAFDKSVRNVHDDMVKQFESDPLMYKRLLNNGNKKIGDKEIVFFWADKTEQNIKIVDKALNYAKNFGSKISQFGRATLSHTLHDAIWVSNPANSKDILYNLNEEVKAQNKQGNEVILYGYSAGSLLTSMYLTHKLPMIELNDLKQDNSYMGRYFANIIKTKQLEPTCLDALKESKIIFYTDSDEFVTNPNVGYLKTTFPNLNLYTDKYCAPKGTVKGAILFGTPLTTFDSGALKSGTSSNTLTQLLSKYVVENDLFFITINYANDFIGMPMPNKPKFSQFEKSDILKDTKPNGGFIYDDSGIKAHSSVISAHLSYWANGKRFAKNIVQAYNDGYKFFYEGKSY